MKACIFDLDGTLTNTLESTDIFRESDTCRRWDFPRSAKDQCRMFVGNGARVADRRGAECSRRHRMRHGLKRGCRYTARSLRARIVRIM